MPLRSSLSLLALTLLLACAPASAPAPERRPPVTFPTFGDSDPHAWEGRSPSAQAIHGVDVARWQTAIDWPTARAAGIAFAFIKATEGGDLRDPMFDAHWQGATRAGIARAAYHFFYFCRPAVEQARWFIENVPRRSYRTSLPHVLDLEWNAFSPTCQLRPDGAIVRREADIFLDLLERYYGRRPIIYTTIDFYRETGIGQLTDTEFWLRSVAGHPGDVYPPGAQWTFWQYTGTGQVPGVRGNVGLNAYRGTPEAWRLWTRG